MFLRRVVCACFLMMMILPQKGYPAWDYAWFSDCNYEECVDFLNQAYIGVDGGWASGLFLSNRSFHVGPLAIISTSYTFGLDVLNGYHVGAHLGYLLNPCWRTDVSYTFFNHHVQWQTAFFGSSTNSYDARLHSHLILWNLYLHLNNMCNGGLGFSPYVMGGVGAAINSLGTISERDFAAVLFAHNSKHTTHNFGARFGLGVLKPFCYQWALDMGFNFNFMGTARSGRTQTLLTGTTLEIKPYRHPGVWIVTFYLGLKYRI